jgi:urocanate hydratase
LPFDSAPSPALSFALDVYALYQAIISSGLGASFATEESPLGGRLLYAGELDSRGRAVVAAGNIAGVVSLTASSDAAVQRQAVRDGIVDFLVTSLDEAVRILKNEVRKHGTVAVCVAADPESVEREMVERGVVPDLMFVDRNRKSGIIPQLEANAVRVEPTEAVDEEPLLYWQVNEAPARWMPKLDAIAAECLPKDIWTMRWLRLVARYCGRSAQGVRVLHCERDAARQVVERFTSAVKQGEIGVPVQMWTESDHEKLIEVASPVEEPRE